LKRLSVDRRSKSSIERSFVSDDRNQIVKISYQNSVKTVNGPNSLVKRRLWYGKLVTWGCGTHVMSV